MASSLLRNPLLSPPDLHSADLPSSQPQDIKPHKVSRLHKTHQRSFTRRVANPRAQTRPFQGSGFGLNPSGEGAPLLPLTPLVPLVLGLNMRSQFQKRGARYSTLAKDSPDGTSSTTDRTGVAYPNTTKDTQNGAGFEYVSLSTSQDGVTSVVDGFITVDVPGLDQSGLSEPETVPRTEEEIAEILDDKDKFAATWARGKRRICIFVEPSPFSYVCGYKNRFQNFIKYLREGGDEVTVITTSWGCPEEFHGAKVFPAWTFSFPFYPTLPVALGFSPRILNIVKEFNPDIIHATSPGIMCFGALAVAKILSKPLVFSYHTHVPKYIPQYTFSFLVHPMWLILRLLHHSADVTLTTSENLGKELEQEGAAAGNQAGVWPKGIDCDTFNPRFRNAETRFLLSGGEPEKPLIVHVGRLGAEKNLSLLRPLLDALPGTRLAFVGDGPYRSELEKVFEGSPTVFTGMLSGDALSSAYASGDVFLMPSETETLGFVVLEAMASGLPVVAARAGGIPDIISKDGVTGFLFEPGNVEQATALTKALLDSRELRERVAEAGRQEVERFDWSASTQSVRRNDYSLAVWRRLQRIRGGWKKFLPWWTKKAEWESVFGKAA